MSSYSKKKKSLVCSKCMGGKIDAIIENLTEGIE